MEPTQAVPFLQIAVGPDGRLYIVPMPTVQQASNPQPAALPLHLQHRHQQQPQQQLHQQQQPQPQLHHQQFSQQLLPWPQGTTQTAGLAAFGQQGLSLPSYYQGLVNAPPPTNPTYLPSFTFAGAAIAVPQVMSIPQTATIPRPSPPFESAAANVRTMPTAQTTLSSHGITTAINATNPLIEIASGLHTYTSPSRQQVTGSTSQVQPAPILAPPPPKPAARPTRSKEIVEGVTPDRPPVLIALPEDAQSLSSYQCIVRQQIEVFQALQHDLDANAQGRNRPIILGQVGIRCKYCSILPPKQRKSGAVYFPSKLSGVYQTAQNMAAGHLCQKCEHVPEDVRQKLLVLKEKKSSAGGGRRYWSDGAQMLGVYEVEQMGLRFHPPKDVQN